MKLYMHPASTVCRPIMLLCAERSIKLDNEVVDLMSGAQYREAYVSLNPNSQVPLLEDGDLRLTESSAILKYICEKHGLPDYPKDIKKRARVNSAMDWFNTSFYRDFGYNLVYPQIFAHHKRRSDESHAGAIEWGCEGSKKWLKILNDYWIGPTNQYIAGNELTIADHFGACIVTLGELIGCGFKDYPNVQRWLANMRKLGSWEQVNEAFTGFAAGNKGKEFVRVA